MPRVQAALQHGACPLSRPTDTDSLRVVSADFLAGAGPGGILPAPTQVELAFAGRSNVGKSSLINTLIQRRSLVRTGATPGLTRQVNLYEVRVADGTLLHFVDLPGYGFAKRSKAETKSWATLIESYLGTRATLAVVVLIVDVRRGIEDDDRELIEFIDAARPPSRRPLEVLVVATKVDKIPKNSRKVELAKIAAAAGRRVIGFSAETGEGREALFRALRRAALGEPPPAEPPAEPPPDQTS